MSVESIESFRALGALVIGLGMLFAALTRHTSVALLGVGVSVTMLSWEIWRVLSPRSHNHDKKRG